MKRRQWDSKTKAKIVLEGLSGAPVSELCDVDFAGGERTGTFGKEHLRRDHQNPPGGWGTRAGYQAFQDTPKPKAWGWHTKGEKTL